MHFIKTIAAGLAIIGLASALPVQKRDEDAAAVVGNPNNPVDDLLTNIKSGIRGGLDFLSIPSGSETTKREVIGDPGNPVTDLLVNVKGGVEGFFDFSGAGEGSPGSA